MKLKTHKAISKRVQVTKKKKIIIRSGGQDHFNGKETGNVRRNKRRDKSISKANTRNIKIFLPYI
jgi:ribosomal protein L35